ncbi:MULTISPECIES: hypothetical protein [unclassified Microbacterium]
MELAGRGADALASDWIDNYDIDIEAADEQIRADVAQSTDVTLAEALTAA